MRVICEGTRDLPSVHCILPGEVASLYPVAEIHDPGGEELGHLPYTPEFFVALATIIARKIHAIASPPFKVIALDCDETLWAGICGEGWTSRSGRRSAAKGSAGIHGGAAPGRHAAGVVQQE